VVETQQLSTLAGYYPYAQVAALRYDAVNPSLLAILK
jgi:hypothetical protein